MTVARRRATMARNADRAAAASGAPATTAAVLRGSTAGVTVTIVALISHQLAG